MCLSQTVMQSILCDAPTPPPPPPPRVFFPPFGGGGGMNKNGVWGGLFHLRLNVDGMNEIDQLGVCWQQPCVNSLGVAVAEHWGV